MGNDSILENQIPGNIIVTSRSNGGTLSVDRQADGGAVNTNPFPETASVRAKLFNRVRGVAPTGTPCLCPNGGSYRRGAAPGAPCATCGGVRADASR
jgi:hypothetical protein